MKKIIPLPASPERDGHIGPLTDFLRPAHDSPAREAERRKRWAGATERASAVSLGLIVVS